MALPILDGNQTATTLSTVVSGGAHIPAHTVVSLGSQAITDMRSAVSGSVVSISNLPATQTIAGTVTANVTSIPTIFSISNYGSLGTSNFITDNNGPQNDLGLGIAYNTDATDPGFAKIVSENYPLPISGTVTAVLSTDTVFNDGGDRLNIGLGSVVGTDPANWLKVDGGSVPVSGTVTASVTNSVTIGSLPRPTWTDYSGTIVTAGTSVTAISTTTRSYLLAQVTTGQMFINIGATATTLNSVYFSAGQGFAWETSVPQGIVSIISSVTGTNYVLKDG